MTGLVLTDGKRAYTTTRIIADGVSVEHESVIRLVKKYADDMNEIGLSRFQIGKVQTGGRPQEVAELDEAQAIFLVTLMKNSKTVVKFKKKLTTGFLKMRDELAKRLDNQKVDGWENARKDGKIIYQQKTDVIKQFVDYATGQGSKSAFRYYGNLAKMENSALFFFEQKYENLREVLTIKQLMQVATADDVIEKALKEGMDQEMFYKDIYKLAKERIVAFADIIGKSPIAELTVNNPRMIG